jgi:hypothetical protein
VPFDIEAMQAQLIARYGHDKFLHGINGIDFHHQQGT